MRKLRLRRCSDFPKPAAGKRRRWGLRLRRRTLHCQHATLHCQHAASWLSPEAARRQPPGPAHRPEPAAQRSQCPAQGYAARKCSQTDGLTDRALPQGLGDSRHVQGAAQAMRPLYPPPPPRYLQTRHVGPLTPPLPCFSAEWRPRCRLHGPSCLHRDSVKGPQATEKGLAQPDGAQSHRQGAGLGILGTPPAPRASNHSSFFSDTAR